MTRGGKKEEGKKRSIIRTALITRRSDFAVRPRSKYIFLHGRSAKSMGVEATITLRETSALKFV